MRMKKMMMMTPGYTREKMMIIALKQVKETLYYILIISKQQKSFGSEVKLS